MHWHAQSAYCIPKYMSLVIIAFLAIGQSTWRQTEELLFQIG